MRQVIIKQGITSIGRLAFANWTSVQTIYIEKGTDTTNWNVEWNEDCKAKIVYL